jgi:fumarylpyruvate hydrolase
MTDDSTTTVPPFNDYLGVRVQRGEGGTAEATLDLEPHHLNMRGVAHGGVVTSLLDSALGAAVIVSMPREWWCATISLSTQFIAGAGTGRLTATGHMLRRGHRVAYAAGEVRDAKNRLIATAHGSWHLWPNRPGGPEKSVPRDRIVIRGSGESIRVGKIVAAGRNYAEHVAEMGAKKGAPPVFFFKPASSLVSGGGVVPIPTSAGAVHHEVELVVVIGRDGSRIRPAQALEHVLGYAVGIDMTLREVQAEAKRRGEPWSLAKGFDGSAPVSAAVPRDQIGDGSGLAISLDVNGKRRQEGNTSQMLHGVPELIASASRWMTLERGDLLFTGTPAGVGPIRPGDKVEARIERVGTLELTIDETT